jgi:putative spermidine/putrescine transport system substrate-binding protein
VDLGRAVGPAPQRRRGRHGDGLDGRVSALIKEGAKVAYTYNQGILQSTSLCILKGPNLATAVRFVNEAVDPVLQANLPLHIDYGPASPRRSTPR